ncbi:MAG: sigma-70 family RNA polymerase sigma factor [Deltaproteobacteria bacterium]|nr:sigma-70 family RNA polymerase sigma factor [Deltaproteobacteria bacterium]
MEQPPEDGATRGEAESAPGTLPHPEEWVDAFGDRLFAYALLRVGDRETAKDLVQETFASALRARSGFAGRSSAKTWLTGILKNKISDHFRRLAREAPLRPAEGGDDFFNAEGRWRDPPSSWRSDPDEALDRSELWAILQRCMAELPPRHRSAFSLRELEGVSTENLCQVLGVTATNLWVLLHRARLALRRCLERGGFGIPGKETAR